MLVFTDRWIAWHVPPLIPISSIKKLSILVYRSNFTLVFLKAAYHANAEDEKNFAGSRSNISRHIFQKLLNTSANNNVSLEHPLNFLF